MLNLRCRRGGDYGCSGRCLSFILLVFAAIIFDQLIAVSVVLVLHFVSTDRY